MTNCAVMLASLHFALNLPNDTLMEIYGWKSSIMKNSSHTSPHCILHTVSCVKIRDSLWINWCPWGCFSWLWSVIISSSIMVCAENWIQNVDRGSEMNNHMFQTIKIKPTRSALWGFHVPSAAVSPTYCTPLFFAQWLSPVSWALNPFWGQKMPVMKRVPSNRWDWTAGGHRADIVQTKGSN